MARSISGPIIAGCSSPVPPIGVSRHRRLLAHRPAGRGGDGERPALGAGDAAHARGPQGCAGKIAHRGVTRARYVATEACRRAGNCEDFLERVHALTGIAIETITTEEEARLAVAGCAPLLDAKLPYAIVFDIGGGSTELVWLQLAADPMRDPEILGTVSLPFGVVTFAERYGGDVISRAGYDAMVREARDAMAEFAERHGVARHLEAGRVQMLGSSGTVTTLAGIHLELPRYNRSVVDGSTLVFDVVRAICDELAAMSYAERAAHPCIGSERADLVVAGCAILEAICGCGRSAACASPIAACARASFSTFSPRRADPIWIDMVSKGGGKKRGREPAKIGTARSAAVRVKSTARRSPSSKQWLERQLNDPYVGEAQRRGYRSRAAFKLAQLDDRFRLLRPGLRVVDLGCAPGGWTQIAVERVKPRPGRGVVIGIDILPMDPVPEATIAQMDFLDPDRAGAARSHARRAGRPGAQRHGGTDHRAWADRPSAHHRARRGGARLCRRRAGAGRRLCRQGLPGWRDGRAAGPAETRFHVRAPCEAAGQPHRIGRDLRRRDGVPRQRAAGSTDG